MKTSLYLRNFARALSLWLILTLTSTVSLHAEIVESIYYIVNNGIISKTDFENRYETFLQEPIAKDFGEEAGREFVISNMILDKLVEQKLSQEGIAVSRMDVSNQINQTMVSAGIPSLSEFKIIIQRQMKMTYKDYFKIVYRKLNYSALISKLTTVQPPSPKEIENYFEKNKNEKFKITDPIYNLSLIFLKVPPSAGFSVKKKIEVQLLKIVEKINNQEITFEEAATRESEEPLSSKVGGKVGWIDPKGQRLTPQEVAAISTLAVNEISRPVVFNNGIGVYKLHEKKTSGIIPKQLGLTLSRNELMAERRERSATSLIEQLYQSSYIKLNTDDLTYNPNGNITRGAN